jgi:hypothetical protein
MMFCIEGLQLGENIQGNSPFMNDPNNIDRYKILSHAKLFSQKKKLIVEKFNFYVMILDFSQYIYDALQ